MPSTRNRKRLPSNDGLSKKANTKNKQDNLLLHPNESVVKEWWVYVLQSQQVRYSNRGKPLPGFFYVGCTTDPLRRLRQHNGEIQGGAKWTSQYRPHKLKAIFGPYHGQSEALKAERALKKGKRGITRTLWTPQDSLWCRGLGVHDPRIPT